MRKPGQLMSALVPLTVLGVAVWAIAGGGGYVGSRVPYSSETASHAQSELPKVKLRAWNNGVALASIGSLRTWLQVTGEHPDIVQLYIGFTKPLPEGELRTVLMSHALPLLQINPRRVSLAAVAAGKYDKQLRADAQVLKKINRPVALSFAHEANGSWYSWGCGHQSSRSYIAAWRHIHRVLGTHNIIWVWTVSHTWRNACSLTARYPGKAYVNWIGIDGYLHAGKSDSSVPALLKASSHAVDTHPLQNDQSPQRCGGIFQHYHHPVPERLI